MQEFAATIAGKIGQLPARPEKKNLETQAKVLQELVAQKATTQQIGLASRALSSALLAAYPVPIALPRVFPMSLAAPSSSRRTAPPAMARQATAGDRARRSSRPPIAFTDAERARKRSLAALEQVISQGTNGTAMQSFSDLAVQDRWALALYAGHFAFSSADVHHGEQLWKDDASASAPAFTISRHWSRPHLRPSAR